MDLQLLWPYQQPQAESPYSIRQDSHKRWILRRYLPMTGGHFMQAALKVALTKMKKEEWWALREALDPAVHLNTSTFHQAQRTNLYVPLDLTRSLEEQFQELTPTLRELQGNLLKLGGRKSPYKRSPEVEWRDLYCYLLSTVVKKTPRQIAGEVFPTERRESATRKVRVILHRYRKALANTSTKDI